MRFPLNIRWGYYFYLAALLFLLPFPWVCAALLAALFHEMGHIAGAAAAGLSVKSVSLDMGSARILTSPATDGQTLLTAISGPAAGFLLCLCYPVFPKLAFCAFLQSMFNLMPTVPFDGGRVLLALCNMIFPTGRGEQAYFYVSAALMIGAVIYLMFVNTAFATMLLIPTALGMRCNQKILLANRLQRRYNKSKSY